MVSFTARLTATCLISLNVTDVNVDILTVPTKFVFTALLYTRTCDPILNGDDGGVLNIITIGAVIGYVMIIVEIAVRVEYGPFGQGVRLHPVKSVHI